MIASLYILHLSTVENDMFYSNIVLVMAEKNIVISDTAVLTDTQY